MTTYVYLLEESSLRLWGLSSRERVLRLLRPKGIRNLVGDLSEVPASASVLLMRGDYLFDSRIVQALADSRNLVLKLAPDEGAAEVAARVPARLAHMARARLLDGHDAPPLPEDVERVTPDALCPAYQQQLLKSDPPVVLPITARDRDKLERLLFGASYKGITDLVTKWVWPVPARWGVRLCVRLGLRPNHVTALSWLLAVAAGWLFWQGAFAWGLVLGWLMTYLDTVDGKLARVTVTSSKFGHLLDHILDLIHPPLWYLAWGLGLASYHPLLLPLGLGLTLWLIVAGYLAGRLVEGAFQLWLGQFGIFSWRKIDSYSRLVTARRNPCLVLLTLGSWLGRPDLGLEAVALWTALSSSFLVLRLAMAASERLSSGPLTSWLEEVEQDPSDRSLAVRWFARRPPRPIAGGPG
jgi:phosphatidylglycerophosphate synthase